MSDLSIEALKSENARLMAELRARESFIRHLENSINTSHDRLMAILDPSAFTQFKRHHTAQRLPQPLTEEETKNRDKRAQEAESEREELKTLGII